MVRIDEVKKAERARFRQIRKDLGAEARARIDVQVAAQVLALPEWQRANVLFTYLSFGAEVDTRALICNAWAADKIVALPWCVPGTHRMRWFRVTSFDNLARSSFGVDEPVPDPANELDPAATASALALVPGLVFDEQGFRMGYGGGFYDTFLADFPGVSVGLAREAQMVDDLRELGVIDVHDRAVQVVASEKCLIRCVRSYPSLNI